MFIIFRILSKRIVVSVERMSSVKFVDGKRLCLEK